ncbi:hypothetical protein GCWU000246_00589 [Jonquetella anthropi E3_33 E1]|nr:hypothetical protein GCWU000246_00589 [Jonquetella anthropi E3_33 E1]
MSCLKGVSKKTPIWLCDRAAEGALRQDDGQPLVRQAQKFSREILSAVLLILFPRLDTVLSKRVTCKI